MDIYPRHLNGGRRTYVVKELLHEFDYTRVKSIPACLMAPIWRFSRRFSSFNDPIDFVSSGMAEPPFPTFEIETFALISTRCEVVVCRP